VKATDVETDTGLVGEGAAEVETDAGFVGDGATDVVMLGAPDAPESSNGESLGEVPKVSVELRSNGESLGEVVAPRSTSRRRGALSATTERETIRSAETSIASFKMMGLGTAIF